MTKVTVAIVSKRQITREGIVWLLRDIMNFEILAAVERAEELVERCGECEPNVILMYNSLPNCGGLRTIQYIHEKLPRSHIVFASDDGKNDDLLTCVNMGVRAFLSHDIRGENLISAINIVAEGYIVLSPLITERIVSAVGSIPIYASTLHLEEISILTARETRVIDLVKEGLTNKEIGVVLCISEHTVKVHMLNVMGKLNAHTRQQAVSSFGKMKQTVYAIHINSK